VLTLGATSPPHLGDPGSITVVVDRPATRVNVQVSTVGYAKGDHLHYPVLSISAVAMDSHGAVDPQPRVAVVLRGAATLLDGTPVAQTVSAPSSCWRPDPVVGCPRAPAQLFILDRPVLFGSCGCYHWEGLTGRPSAPLQSSSAGLLVAELPAIFAGGWAQDSPPKTILDKNAAVPADLSDFPGIPDGEWFMARPGSHASAALSADVGLAMSTASPAPDTESSGLLTWVNFKEDDGFDGGSTELAPSMAQFTDSSAQSIGQRNLIVAGILFGIAGSTVATLLLLLVTRLWTRPVRSQLRPPAPPWPPPTAGRLAPK
jgi:hypothetical protein